MLIQITPSQANAIVLASADAAVDDNYAPPAEVEIECESMVQDSRPINAANRKLYARGNTAGKLSFTVRPRYETLAKAAAGAATLASYVNTSGELTVKPAPEGSSAATSLGHAGNTAFVAIIRRVKARQIGVTVEAHYEIEW